MRVCVVGAGAIGGYLAGKLALAGHEVAVVARGAHREAIRQQGLVLVDQHGNVQRARVECVGDDGVSPGVQDVLILTVKAHQIAAIAPDLVPFLGEQTPVVALQNGIPWWYFHRHGGPFEGRRLESVDPGGAIERCLPVSHVCGAVAQKAAEVSEPGVIRHTVTEADRFPLGEPDGSRSARIEAVSALLEQAGIAAPISSDIRTEKWFKLWGNLVWNPVSALTQANVLEIHGSSGVRQLGVTMMLEAQAVALRLGIAIPGTPQARMARAVQVGAVRPSMLQDVQAGRPLEIEALLGAVVELADLTDVPIPSIAAVYACTQLLDSVIVEHAIRLRPQPSA